MGTGGGGRYSRRTWGDVDAIATDAWKEVCPHPVTSLLHIIPTALYSLSRCVCTSPYYFCLQQRITRKQLDNCRSVNKNRIEYEKYIYMCILIILKVLI